jgi:hypothetical protein
VVGVWAPGHAEPVVVLTDQPPRWAVLRQYDWCFWTAPGFRNDKTRGWQWEHSPVPGVAHHERLLLALAWARLPALAARPIRVRAGRSWPGKPQHARESLFTLGVRCTRTWLSQAWAGAFPWRLPGLDGPSWTQRWKCHQAYRFIFQTVRP